MLCDSKVPVYDLAPSPNPSTSSQARLYKDMEVIPTSPKTRIELKTLLSQVIPTGEEQRVLDDAQRQLKSSQEEIKLLTARSIAVGRDISVRERKLADWKGKIAREGMRPPTRALERAGEMDWCSIGNFFENDNTLVLHKMYRRSMMGLSGFSHAWLILVGTERKTTRTICTLAVAMEKVEENTGVIKFDMEKNEMEMEECDIIDIKPYLAYCDAASK